MGWLVVRRSVEAGMPSWKEPAMERQNLEVRDGGPRGYAEMVGRRSAHGAASSS